MKKILILIVGVVLSVQAGAKDAKYIFYFIGDGMAINVIAATEYYKAACDGRIGTEPLNFHSFPVTSFATAYNSESEISDSASSGTALATGHKTKTRHVGTDPDGKPLTNLAEVMSKAGKQIGVITSVNVNDATPAVFYSHQLSRKDYMEITTDLGLSPFAFIAGNSFGTDAGHTKEMMLREASSGRTLIRSLEEYDKVKGSADRITFIPSGKSHFKEAINREEGDGSTTLGGCLKATIDFLELKDRSGKGFFIMAEGGSIDHCAHKNDMAATINEVLDLEDAVAVAIEFYNRHPEETAILVTSDHDTGGPAILAKDYRKLALLSCQKMDISTISHEFVKHFKSNPEITWEQYKDFMAERTGMWGSIEVNGKDEKALKKIFDDTIGEGKLNYRTDEYKYGSTPLVIKETFAVYNRYAGIVWTHTSHTAGFVPVFYKGPHPELFGGPLDNTSFFPILKKVAGIR